MPEKKWEDMTDDELRDVFEQAQREDAIRLGVDPVRHIKRGWDAIRIDARKQEKNICV